MPKPGGLMRSRLLVFFALLLASAIAVVELRHESRASFARLQALQAERDALNTEWGQLLLEEATWSQHRRIDAVARARLTMDMPHPDRIRAVRLEGEGGP